MTQEALKKMYQLLLTEPHAPTVCAQLERIAREALAEHAMREVQRLGQEIEQKIGCVNHDCDQCKAPPEQEPHGWYIDGYGAVIGTAEPKSVRVGEWLPWYTTPPQRKPLTEQEIGAILEDINAFGTRLYTFARAIEAAHGIKGEA